ncbi:MAG TPA: response regulator, partial [Spirochaetales bacterium]|nr:response regulator [Spirochaetales bacterium]
MERIKVMVVDDSAVVRQTLKELLDSDPGIEVLAVASDPIFALKKLETERPDVIVSDVEMPRMDGL